MSCCVCVCVSGPIAVCYIRFVLLFIHYSFSSLLFSWTCLNIPRWNKLSMGPPSLPFRPPFPLFAPLQSSLFPPCLIVVIQVLSFSDDKDLSGGFENESFCNVIAFKNINKLAILSSFWLLSYYNLMSTKCLYFLLFYSSFDWHAVISLFNGGNSGIVMSNDKDLLASLIMRVSALHSCSQGTAKKRKKKRRRNIFYLSCGLAVIQYFNLFKILFR